MGEERAKEQEELDAAQKRKTGCGNKSPGQSQQSYRRCPHTDPSSRGRARTFEGTGETDGGRTRGGTQETSVPSPDLIGGPELTLQEWLALHDQHVGQHKGAIMETLISRGNTLARVPTVSVLWIDGRSNNNRCKVQCSTGSGTVWVQRMTCRRGFPPMSTNVHVQNIASSWAYAIAPVPQSR